MGGLSFGKTAEGEWGYKPEGADAVIPFSNASLTDISNQFSEPVYVDSPAQAHRVTALADLTEYKYVILAFARRNEMWMNGNLYVTNCIQIGYLTAGDM